MKQLIVLRSGPHKREGLSDLGRKLVTDTALQIEKVTHGGKTVVISSTTTHAMETADILGETLGVIPEYFPGLCLNANEPIDLKSLYDHIQDRIVDDDPKYLILVTHRAYVAQFPRYYAQQALSSIVCSYAIDNGSAWVLHLDNTNLKRITPRSTT